MMEQKTKKCSDCGKTLLLSNFAKHNVSKDGHSRCCKECAKAKRYQKTRRVKPIVPQPGIKATFGLVDFDDPQLFAELRRRGYTGELRFAKVITV